jgi:CHAT domain-containing protein/tetratricopeptide (TPR) repeat protein
MAKVSFRGIGVSLLLAVVVLASFASPLTAAPVTQDDPQARADALFNEGVDLYYLADNQGALEKFEAALALYREIGDRAGEAFALDFMGFCFERLGYFVQALDYCEEALIILREIGDRVGEAYTLKAIAILCLDLAEHEDALDYYLQALALAQEMGDTAAESDTLTAIGYVAEAAYAEGMDLTSYSEYQRALGRLQTALAAYQVIGNRLREGTALNAIGMCYERLGQNDQALECLEESLIIAREVGDRFGEASALNSIALVYGNVGRYEEALNHQEQALTIAREIGDRQSEARALDCIGIVYDYLGRYEEALDYHEQALALAQEVGDELTQSDALLNIGDIHQYSGQYEEALDYYTQALALARETNPREWEASTLEHIGGLHYLLGQYEEAFDYYMQALAVAREIGLRKVEASALGGIGYVYYLSGQYEEALNYQEQALAIHIESEDREGEAGTLAAIGRLYRHLDQRDEAISYYQQAIELFESIQSEMKIEELQTSYAAEQVPVYELLIGLLWEEDRLGEAFNYGERARARAFLDQLAGGRVDFRSGVAAELLEQEADSKAQIAARRGQLVSLRNRPREEWDTETIAAVEDELTTLESDYAALLTQIKLQSPEAASLVSVDVASLSDIQGALGADTTLLEYFVTEDQTLVFIITQDTYETESLEVSREELADTITTFRDFASLDDPHPASLQQLHTWLIAPIEDHLETSMVGIVPHGVLHYLPFAALTDGERYLGEEYVLFTLPSASALTFIQEKRKDGADTVLALGNPIIVEDLPVLQFAEGEVEAIAELYETEALVGAEATEGAVWSQAAGAGILHLAAHGSYNQYNPLFSAVHLAEDEENDGRLEVHEVYGLDLTESTDLVVLSACQTQMGALSAGDEVVGLTRALLYAGTPSVIASLWSVDDQATALLMERFYTHLQAGLGKGEALRQAQMDVRAEYPHPYYWAAFVLTGDAGEVTQGAAPGPTQGGVRVCWGAALPVGLVMLVGLRRRRGLQVLR